MHYKKKIDRKAIPKEFCEATLKTISRIENNHNVYGVLYLENDALKMATTTDAMTQVLQNKLPPLTAAARRAVTEIDVLDDVIAVRIESHSFEIAAVVRRQFTACVVHKLTNKSREHYQETV